MLPAISADQGGSRIKWRWEGEDFEEEGRLEDRSGLGRLDFSWHPRPRFLIFLPELHQAAQICVDDFAGTDPISLMLMACA